MYFFLFTLLECKKLTYLEDIMIKRLCMIRALACFYTLSLLAASDSTINEGVAIVRVWNMDNDRCGHVTLQTQNSYISLWPENSVTLEDPHSPAICVTTPQKDIEKEGKVADFKYTIALESKNVDAMWLRMLQTMADGASLDSEQPLRNVTWFGPSGSIILEPNEGHLHLNCASTVLLALKSGGINIDPILSSIKSAQDLTRSTAAIAQSKTPNTSAEDTLIQAAAGFALYSSIVKPGNIAEFVGRLIQDRMENKLATVIEAYSITLLDHCSKTDTMSYLKSMLPKETKVRSSNWFLNTYLPRFGTLTIRADSAGYLLQLNEKNIRSPSN